MHILNSILDNLIVQALSVISFIVVVGMGIGGLITHTPYYYYVPLLIGTALLFIDAALDVLEEIDDE